MYQNRRSTRAAVIVAALLIVSGCAAPGQSPPTQEPTPEPTLAASGPALENDQEPTASVAAPERLTFMTADGMFEFDYPAGWSVVADPASEQEQEGVRTVTVLEAQGRKMATLTTGFPAANDSVVTGPIAPVALEYSRIPETQIPATFEDTAIAFHYETKFNPVLGEVGAEMSINSFKAGFPITSSLPGFHIDLVSGASFTRWIGPSEDLPDVDPTVSAIDGIGLYEAYQQTPEYLTVKAMMLSLRRVA